MILKLQNSQNQDSSKALTDLTAEDLRRVNGGDYPNWPGQWGGGGDWGGGGGQDQGQGQDWGSQSNDQVQWNAGGWWW